MRSALRVLVFASDSRGPQSAALLGVLRRGFDARVIPLAPPDRLLPRVAGLLRREAYDAAVFLDGGMARSALALVRQGWPVPAVLASFPEETSSRPDAGIACAPEAHWCFAREPALLSSDGLVPRASHRRERVDAAWVQRRLEEVAGRRRAQVPPPARGLTSVVIPCWNNLRLTRECVDSLRRCTSARSYELILVDNGSSEETARYLRSVGRGAGARLIRNRRNLGFGRAINQGMRAAKGDPIVWLNNDTLVTPGWLDRLLACAGRAPWIGAVGPLTNDDLPADGRGAAPERISAALAMRNAGSARPMHWLLGFCLLVKRQAMERVGLLDERFGPGLYEDYDYCLRLRQAGYEVMLAEDAFVYHHWHRSLLPTGAQARARINRDLFVDKWCRAALRFVDRLGARAQSAQTLTRPLFDEPVRNRR